MVPYERNQFFVGRDSFLGELHDIFQTNSRPASQHLGGIAILGNGRIGKSQINLEFLYRPQTSYSRIYWISAVTLESMLDGYEKIEKRANVPIMANSKPVAIVEQVIVLLWLSPPFCPRVHYPHLRYPLPHRIPQIHPPNRSESQVKVV